MNKRNVCIVTPDVIGPIKNGGIGTHAFFLANDLSAESNVTILFTGPIENESSSFWEIYYKNIGITFVHVDSLPRRSAPANTDWFIERSYSVFLYLRSMNFHTIHFQDWQANGFHTIQAKRSTKYFQETFITVTMHSSTEWINEGNRKWLYWPVPDAKLQWCERYCCANCDLLVSPSQHMFDWALGHGWNLAENRKVIRYCFKDKVGAEYIVPQARRIAFFGRLETRKGLDIFVEAINALPPNEKKRIEKVFFVGKNGFVGDQQGIDYITSNLSLDQSRYEISDDLDAAAALKHLIAVRPVVFVPSLLDNYPFTVIECCMSGLDVMASKVGGIPEMLEESHLFEPNRNSLKVAIGRVLRSKGNQAITHKIDPATSKAEWLELSSLPAPKGRYELAVEAVRKNKPLVSICTPYFNYGKYLEVLIESLKRGNYENWELIVVNDGSTDPYSSDLFMQLSAANRDSRVRFIDKLNEGVGATRNRAAREASGRYLIFMDADNLATPTMISDFLAGIEAADTDIMTCHFKAFSDKLLFPQEDDEPLYTYMPIGPALEVGWLQNVFGDANFIIKKDVFEALGGFKTERHTSWEDWDLLARAALAGYKQDVIPLLLFWYRHTPEGFSRNTNLYENHQRVLKAYTDALPSFASHMLRSVATPLHYRFVEMHERNHNQRDSGETLGARIGRKIDRLGLGLFPLGSRRRAWVRARMR